MEKTTRCTMCAAEFSDEELKGAEACPRCGSTSIPCDVNEDVTIKVNWHELRILGIWASNWALEKCSESSTVVLSAILDRLEKQFPDKTPLSLAREIKKLQEEFPTISLIQNGDVVVPSIVTDGLKN